jgi:glycosyltransferase involved in cell wall biosynthesis
LKISVVTVCRNAERTIAATIDSFRRQTHPDKELLIIDGASTDGTLAIARGLATGDIRIVTEPDKGMYDAANKGLVRFKGDGVGFLNADDRFHDDDVLADISSGLTEADIVFGNVDFTAVDRPTRVVRRWRGTPFAKGAFRRGWMPAHPSFYVRRRVVDAVGKFDLTYRIAADYDWMLRACELFGFRTELLDRTVADMTMGGASTAGIRSYFAHNFEALRSRRRWLASGVIDLALFAKPLRKLNQLAVR